MKELKSDLSNVKIGDLVCTAQNGWCKVYDVGVVVGDEHAIVVRVERGGWSYTYTLSGRYYPPDAFPTCFPADQVPEGYISLFGPPPIEFKDGEPVWVSRDGKEWYPRVFKERGSNRYCAYSNVGNYSYWEHCRKWEDLCQPSMNLSETS